MLNQKIIRTIIFTALGFFFFMITGCVSVSEKTGEQSEQFIDCKEPRPYICTMEYRPVCGTMADGSQKTYSNACSTCSDKNVTKYKPGECPQ